MRLTLAERNRQLSSAIATCNTVFETTERQRRAAVRNLSTSLHELLPLGARVRVSIDGRPSGGIQDLERVLVAAADHLAENGMLSGETEASVLSWESAVSTPPEDIRKPRAPGGISIGEQQHG